MIKIMEFLGKTNPLTKPYRGLVVDNNDPKKLQRVRCTIDGLMNGPVETLPWIYPKNPPGLGARQDIGLMMPPVVNTELVIEFPTEDIYAPFYTGTWQSADTHAGTFNEDYPASYGFTDDVGNTFRVNRAKGFSEWKASSGARLRFEKDSTVELRTGKKIRFVSEDGKTEFVFDLELGEVKLNPKQSMEIQGLEHKVTSQKVTIDTGTVNETVSGAKITKVLSGHKLSIGGPSSESIVGSKGVAIGGSLNHMVAGTDDSVIGQGTTRTIAIGGEATKILVGDSKHEMLLGDKLLKILLGNVEYEAIAGSLTFKNLIAKLDLGIAGSIELSNLLGKLKIDTSGQIEMSNNLGSFKVSPAGALVIKSMLTAEFSGLVQTKVGSSAGITMVEGSLVLLGGGGLPVARVGDICMGVGNLGIPVISNIMLGSFKVLCG